MRDEILSFIEKNNLSVFGKSNLRSNNYSIFKTKDSKEIHQKVLTKITENFVFQDTKLILKFLDFTEEFSEINKRQLFFKSLKLIENQGLKKLKKGIPIWKPNYDSVVVTEDESTLVKLKELGCSVVFVNQQSDLFNLDRYDLIQYIDCGNFENILERLPNTIQIDKLEEAYLERFLIELSAWKNNLEILKQTEKTEFLQKILDDLDLILPLIENQQSKPLEFRDIEQELEKINEKIILKIKEMTLSGESVVSLLIKGIPKEIRDVLEKQLSESQIPRHLFQDSIPLKLDEKEVDSFLKKQSTLEFMDSAAKIKKNSSAINKISKLLKELEKEILYQDFISGVTRFFQKTTSFPELQNEFNIKNSRNLFIENPEPISFNLNPNQRCSILTGANSGGKTTLIEHIIQLVSLFQLGFPVSGEMKTPLFTEVYYFAKNKGSMSKGAFETLLTQMSEIQPGEKTLILADEIEAVTEPGVAGEIIVSTAEYFIEKNCFLVIATHLGQEVQHLLPEKCRIDGIEAKGLTESYELIVDHNPVLGKLANSTPELIIEKMARSQQKPYFNWLFENLKKRKI